MKKIVSGLLAAAMAFTSVGLPVMGNGAHAHIETGIVAHAESYDFSYSKLDDNCVMLTRYYGSDTDVIVPSEIDGYRVTFLDETFCANKNIKSVTIPESVEAIGEDTFAACSNLESVQIGENVKGIGEYAFGYCTSLKEITLPQSVEYIGKQAFYNCTALEEITLPQNLEKIGSRAFYNCTALTDVTINGNVSRLKGETFSGCSALKSVNFAANCLERIDKNAFTGCKELSEISGLDSLKELGTDVFTDTAWLAAKKQESPLVTVGSVLIDGKNYAEADLAIPDGIVMIADNAFKGNTNIKSLTVPQSVERIGDLAFNLCSNLSSISVHETLDDFGYWCFGSTPWMDAQKKDSDYVTLNSVLLYMKNSKGNIVIPDGVVGISDGFFKDSRDLLSVQFPEGLKFIGRNSFEDCYYLEEVTLPEGLEEIREGAFYSSQKIVSIYMPQSVTEIGEYAFYFCCALQDLTLSQNITSIKDYTFYGCGKLKEFYVPEKVTYIGEAAIGSATKLNGGDVYIHGGVTEMANDALVYNSVIYYSGTEEDFNSISRPFYDQSITELRRLSRIKYEQHPDIVEPIGDQSCTSEGVERHTCRVCGRVAELTAPPKAHNYGEWTVVEEATCTAVGTREHTCLDCGHSEKVRYGPVHDYDWEVVQEPTCDRYGISNGVCKICGNTTKVYPSALGHDYGERVEVEATCTSDGYYMIACNRCGIKNKRPSGKYATGHIYSDWEVVKEPTCQEEGKEQVYCMVCGHVLWSNTIRKLSCEYGDWVVTKEPTCAEEGEKQRACKNCGQTESAAIKKSAHTYGEWEVVKEANCSEFGLKKRVCTVCGEEDEQKISTNGKHDYGDWIVIKKATCFENGRKKKVCAICGRENEQDILAKRSHTYGEWEILKEVTCLENGLRKKVCEVCGDEVEEVVKSKGSHTWDWVITIQPTCYSTGLKEKVCTVCGEINETESLQMLDHDNSGYEIIEEATCTEDGSEKYTCSMCGREEIKVIPALGHDYGQITVIKKPTCTDYGLGIHECKRCGMSEEEELPRTGHDVVIEDTLQPTCTEDGADGRKHCRVCGKILNNGTRIPKLGHAYTKWTVERHATNKHTGVRWRECTRCDYFDIDIIPMVQYDINDAWIKLSRTKYTYTGKAKKPAVTVIFSGKKLKANTDYTVKYSNNIAAGRAKVTIKGKGGYKGTVVKYFKILPAKQKIKAVAPLANSFAVTWTKDSGVTGYQVMYGTKSDLSDGKSVDITSNTKGKKTVKGLKAKKTYYVKVRSYKNVGNSKYYGAWSDVKKVKTK